MTAWYTSSRVRFAAASPCLAKLTRRRLSDFCTGAFSSCKSSEVNRGSAPPWPAPKGSPHSSPPTLTFFAVSSMHVPPEVDRGSAPPWPARKGCPPKSPPTSTFFATPAHLRRLVRVLADTSEPWLRATEAGPETLSTRDANLLGGTLPRPLPQNAVVAESSQRVDDAVV